MLTRQPQRRGEGNHLLPRTAVIPPPPQALEDLLAAHHVRFLVLPSVKSLRPMWQGAFRFVPFTIKEQNVSRAGFSAAEGDERDGLAVSWAVGHPCMADGAVFAEAP